MDSYAAEPVEVLRIRLWNAGNATALLAECQGADRVLASWAGHAGSGAVGFEVVLADGRVVRGSHAFFSRGKRACLFATHVRRLLRAGRPRGLINSTRGQSS